MPNVLVEDVTIKTELRPDYYEFFPFFSGGELIQRVKYFPFHKATMLGTRNILTYIYYLGATSELRRFLTEDPARQAERLADVMLQIGVSSRVAHAIRKVDRPVFVPINFRKLAYLNEYIPFDSLSCLSIPGLVALMVDRLNPQPGEKILDVGCGSGYHAACVSESTANQCKVYGIELNEKYHQFGKSAVQQAGYDNIFLIRGDGLLGWPEPITFDRIYIAASSLEGFPMEVVKQLKNRGIIQSIRPLSREEFENEGRTSWLRRTYEHYDGYIEGNWRTYSCLVTARKIEGKIVEIDHLYDVRFTPLHQDVTAYIEDKLDPFSELRTLLAD